MARPIVTLKLATSLDGKIALSNGTSEWITCEESRAAGRELRADHDAIAVGANTAHVDNPQLTARIAGAPDPVRVVFDSRARLSPKSNLAQTAKDTPVYLFCQDSAVSHAGELSDLGVKLLPCAVNASGLNIETALSILHSHGIKSLLIEGGGQLAASFLALNCVDHIHWFRAPMILGGDGRACVGELGLANLDGALRYTRVGLREIGADICETYQRREL